MPIPDTWEEAFSAVEWETIAWFMDRIGWIWHSKDVPGRVPTVEDLKAFVMRCHESLLESGARWQSGGGFIVERHLHAEEGDEWTILFNIAGAQLPEDTHA